MSFATISVWMTTYNQRDYVANAIESILAQSIRPCELVIVDDVSTDGTQDILRDFAARHPTLIQLVLNEQRLGIPRNKSKAAEMARGDYVTWIDGDDRFRPDKLEKDLGALKATPSAAIAISDTAIVDSSGKQIGCRRLKRDWKNVDSGQAPSAPSKDIYLELFDFNNNLAYFRNETVRRSCFEKTGYFDLALEMWQDWDLRIRLTQYFQVTYVSHVLQEYRMHADSAGAQASRCAQIEAIAYIYLKYAPFIKKRVEIMQFRKIKSGVFCYLAPYMFDAVIHDSSGARRSFIWNSWRHLFQINPLLALLSGFTMTIPRFFAPVLIKFRKLLCLLLPSAQNTY